MSETIKILDKEHKESPFCSTNIGFRTHQFLSSLKKLDDEGKIVIVDEATKILSHCIKPGTSGNITNIAVGYIQSGKTMSYTTLSALAADNGYRIIIYFTGITTTLNKQTYSRVRNDLHANDSKYYAIFEDKGKFDKADALKIKKYLSYSKDTTLLFPVMKHYAHISALARLFKDPLLKNLLIEIGVLIIDDEADQASFNTYARQNSNKEDWEVDDFSKTYASIISLRSIFPSLSYIQYTATPQSAFLIDADDILSPKYHTVLSPGKGYTGGKFFFKNKDYQLIHTIPDDEVYDYKRNNLKEFPSTLQSALIQFLYSVAIAVVKDERTKFLSMMVHPDGFNDSNEKFYIWIQGLLNSWLEILNAKDGDPSKVVLLQSFKPEFEEIIKYMDEKPSFAEINKHLSFVILRTEMHLVQDGASIDVVPEKDIDWDNAPSHILVGANILNRGYTVEHLSMTYMPRTSTGKATADTIEQRCRFFGYKMSYIEFCRVFLSAKSKKEFEDYVDHEEKLRDLLKSCDSLAELSKDVRVMQLSNMLNPTRSNILSKRLIRGKMEGWRQMGSTSYIDENKPLFKQFLMNCSGRFVVFNPSQKNAVRRHRYAKISIEEFLEFFKKVQYADLPNKTRKIATIQYLEYLRSENISDDVYVFEMSYDLDKNNWRERTIIDGKPNNIFMPYTADKSLPDDKEFKFDDSITFQIHHLRIKNDGWDHHKDFYNLTVYYPKEFGDNFIAIDQED